VIINLVTAKTVILKNVNAILMVNAVVMAVKLALVPQGRLVVVVTTS